MGSVGFTWKKTVNNEQALIEKPDILEMLNFLRKTMQYRKKEKKIIYMD
jgi:hypothetical protein